MPDLNTCCCVGKWLRECTGKRRQKDLEIYQKTCDVMENEVLGKDLAQNAVPVDWQVAGSIPAVSIQIFISKIHLLLYRLSPLFCLITSSHRPWGPWGWTEEKGNRPFLLLKKVAEAGPQGKKGQPYSLNSSRNKPYTRTRRLNGNENPRFRRLHKKFTTEGVWLVSFE